MLASWPKLTAAATRVLLGLAASALYSSEIADAAVERRLARPRKACVVTRRVMQWGRDATGFDDGAGARQR
jgi:hypothetical protein